MLDRLATIETYHTIGAVLHANTAEWGHLEKEFGKERFAVIQKAILRAKAQSNRRALLAGGLAPKPQEAAKIYDDKEVDCEKLHALSAPDWARFLSNEGLIDILMFSQERTKDLSSDFLPQIMSGSVQIDQGGSGAEGYSSSTTMNVGAPLVVSITIIFTLTIPYPRTAKCPIELVQVAMIQRKYPEIWKALTTPGKVGELEMERQSVTNRLQLFAISGASNAKRMEQQRSSGASRSSSASTSHGEGAPASLLILGGPILTQTVNFLGALNRAIQREQKNNSTSTSELFRVVNFPALDMDSDINIKVTAEALPPDSGVVVDPEIRPTAHTA
ncbi:unnamed protein product [Amoebophrya sp. A25]|nr:unnamed protein product [Amoebophrya sp. A25]|eukprot:GSA25T00026994001.1